MTKTFFAAIAALSALALAGIAPAPTAGIAAPAKPKWADTVTVTGPGGHALGNPKAPRQLVEYMSYTCPHCAAFESEAHDTLRSGPIANGTLSFEVRNLVRDPIDLTVALTARCGSAKGFFARHQALLASQRNWLGKAYASDPATQQSWNTGAINDRLKKIAADLGLYDEVRKASPSLTNAQIDMCLSSKAEQDKVVAMTRYAGETLKVTGTPSFTINGALLDKVHDWSALQPKLASR